MLTPSIAYTSSMMLVILATMVGAAFGQDCKMSKYITPNSGPFYVYDPGFTQPYSPGQTCYYYLYTDRGNTLTVDCPVVELDRVGNNCSDTLKFLGTPNSDVEFCTPLSVQSTDYRILMVFNSRERSRGGRFICEIRAMRKQTCDCGWSNTKRIVGGKETGVNEFPFMVSLVNARAGMHFCGGAIISSRFVVTAAHCLAVLRVEWTGILVGEHSLSRNDSSATRLLRAERFFIHPDYNSATAWNDIGLIRSATEIQFSLRVGPICLPFNRPNLPAVSDFVTAMGWGTTSFGGPMSDVLLKVQLEVVPQSRCIAYFNTSATSGKQFCTFTQGKDTCQMDSGGPLVIYEEGTARMFHAGVVSFGGGCASDAPAVSTRVFSYLRWIQDTTRENFCMK